MSFFSSVMEIDTLDVLVFAAHCDDAILSLGGFLSTAEKARVVTLFGTCAWSCLEGLSDVQEITDRNVQEERDACQYLGIESQIKSFPEALIRGYTNWDDVEDPTLDQEIIIPMRKIISAEMRKAKTVFFPAAIGEHVDHVVVHNLVSEVQRDLKVDEIYIYEDLPYAAYGGTENRIESLGLIDVPPLKIDISDEFEKKLAALRIYKTQLAEQDLNLIEMYSRHDQSSNVFHERIWRWD